MLVFFIAVVRFKIWCDLAEVCVFNLVLSSLMVLSQSIVDIDGIRIACDYYYIL